MKKRFDKRLAVLVIILASLMLTMTGLPVLAANMTGDNVTIPKEPSPPPPVEVEGIPFDPPELEEKTPIIPTRLSYGQKVVLSEGIVATYLGKVGLENEFVAIIGAPQYLPDLETRISTVWRYNVDEKQYYTGANLFYAVVDWETDTTIVGYEGSKYSWRPDVYIGGVLQETPSKAILGYDPINSNYIGNTLQWDYGKGLTRNLRIIEGVLIEYYTISAIPQGDTTIKPNIKKDAGFIWDTPVTAWDAKGKPVQLIISGDNITLPLADIGNYTLPITIDPDTSFVGSNSNYCVRGTNSNYNTAWTAAVGTHKWYQIVYLGQGLDSLLDYTVRRVALYFDTSALPYGTTVTAGILKLYGKPMEGGSPDHDFDLTIQTGMPLYPHDPLELADYNKVYYSGDGGNMGVRPGWSTNSYNEITLSADGRSWVNTTGWTKFMMRSSLDISGTSPAHISGDYVSWHPYNVGVGFWPLLEITYLASDPPTTTTWAADDIAKNSATVNSFLDDDGGEECEVRFAYDIDSGAPYAEATAWVDDYITGQYPSAGLTGLAAATPHYFRVEAKNSQGTTNGAELTFTTLATLNPPTNFTATPRSPTEISLSWTKGVGASSTFIKMKTGTFPVDETDGTTVYNGTAGSVLVEGLITGTTYFFKAWGVDEGAYSGVDITEIGTAQAGEVGVEAGDIDTPAGFWDSTTINLANLPFYDHFNEVADKIDMPRTTFWIIFAMALPMVLGMAIFVKTDSPMWAVVGVGGGMYYWWQTGLFPGWTLVVFVGIAVAVLILGIRSLGGATE